MLSKFTQHVSEHVKKRKFIIYTTMVDYHQKVYFNLKKLKIFSF